MAITKEKKQEITEKVKGILADSESVVFVNFNGLDIASEQGMRSKLKEEGIGYYVAKKTLIGRALDTTTVEGERPSFEGELAIAYGTDSVAPAREVYSFVKEHKEALAIRGGIFEGGYKNAEEMTTIAQIPSMHALRGMFANVINSPIQGFVMALNAIAEKRETQDA